MINDEMIPSVLCDSPTKIANISGAGDEDIEEIEDSVDGCIREEFPRRSGAMSDMMKTLMDPQIPV